MSEEKIHTYIEDFKYIHGDAVKLAAEGINYLVEHNYCSNWLVDSSNKALMLYENKDPDNMKPIGIIVWTEYSNGIWISLFYIREEYRSEGLGKNLFNVFKSKMISLGHNKIMLGVNPKNTKAIKFYHNKLRGKKSMIEFEWNI